VASTRRKRQTKHRGNAAGKVEVRGRTGRKPMGSERKASGGRTARATRFDKPPSWRSSFNRALIAAAVFVAASIVILKQKPIAGVAFGVFLVLFYTPLTFYTDSFFYKRRQAKLAAQRSKQ
jgi:Flp pilus assembly protein TadB